MKYIVDFSRKLQSEILIFIIVVCYIALWGGKSEAVEYWFGTREIYSENRQYVLTLTGLAGDIFYDEYSLALYDNTQQELWKKSIDYAGNPTVSNTGETAIPVFDKDSQRMVIGFYNRQGDMIGIFPRCPSEFVEHFKPGAN